jgi:hypothetical protein
VDDWFEHQKISCQYRSVNLDCETDINGNKSDISLPANQPYVFVPGGFESLDWTWFMTGVTCPPFLVQG